MIIANMLGVYTRGRRSLIALLQITTGREVAARCRVSPSCVSEWAGGTKSPGPASRAKLAELYGINPASWDQVNRVKVPLDRVSSPRA
jgi:hypothetical protein